MRYSGPDMSAEATDSAGNRLGDETSPYLRQHADNPVDWFPWCAEAFDLAKETGKPVLLSVGYSACHWCHVMAHESFEDQATAELMNRLFVNVKVDREERPDVDRIYQTAHQLLTHRGGGWPLTMFIDPEDQRPFFGGTYFPNEPRHGMPSFRELLTRVAVFYREMREEVKQQGAQLADIFRQLEPEALQEGKLDDAPIAAARAQIGRAFDREYGGFTGAPKFPHPATLEWLLRYWRGLASSDEPDVDALFLVTLTCTRMAEGGLYDHLGGGFCRYSVDRYWQIPHFEKMLYDNGPLLALYAQAGLASGETLFNRVAAETADWMIADMQSPDGGFYSTRDADSEGEEGKYYVWTPDEVRALVSEREYDALARYFGLDGAANFEGQWHLSVRTTIDKLARELAATAEETRSLLDSGRSKLLATREERVAPGRDEKILTSWNALAIRGLAIAGRTLQRADLVAAAERAATFIRTTMMIDGRLYAGFKDGRVRFPAYLDDHAFMLDALLELLQSSWSTRNLEFAIELAELLLEHFEDAGAGGFFFTADDHEALMHRMKPLADEATPSGNGIAAFALQRLGFLLGETRYLDAAEKTLKCAWRAMAEFPHGHVSLITALEEFLEHPEIIIIRGDAADIERWRDSATRLYAPRRLVFAIAANEAALPGALVDRKAVKNQTIAYRCVGTHCDLPVTTFEALAATLGEQEGENGD